MREGKRFLEVTPVSPLWAIKEKLKKLNAGQMEDLLNEFLNGSNVKITRSNKEPSANHNFRTGVIAGLCMSVVLAREPETALLHQDPCISMLAKLLREAVLGTPK